MAMKINIGIIMRRMAKERALTTMYGSGNDRKFPKSTRDGDSENRAIDGYTRRSKGSSGDNSDRNRSDDGYESVGYDVFLRRDKNFHIAKDKDDYGDYDMDDY